MATYVVGDLQGCFEPLQRLLQSANFDSSKDTLLFAGDLVNRGPDNLRVLRFIKELGSSAISILGNHDLHLLAVSVGAKKIGRKDTIQDILNAPDREQLLHWLRHRPLLHSFEYQNRFYVMSHAGIPHIWSVNEALNHANEVESVLRSANAEEFFHTMYGNKPKSWTEDLQGWDRLRAITNYFTRMRFIDKDGHLDLDCKGPSDLPPTGMKPWFQFPRVPQDQHITFLFGHWAALYGITGDYNFLALDTGCVWGNKLTMLRLEDHQLFQVNSNPFLGDL